jgi:hypothetical protein
LGKRGEGRNYGGLQGLSRLRAGGEERKGNEEDAETHCGSIAPLATVQLTHH